MQARHVMMLAGMAMVMATLGGCKRYYGHQGYLMDQQLLDSILPGVDNRASVQKVLGHPTYTTQFSPGEFNDQPENSPEWYYVSRGTRQYAFERPHETSQTVMRVAFGPDGTVVEVQETGMERVKKIKPYGPRTPTRGHDRNFLNSVFGNIGSVGAAAPPSGPGGSPNGG